MNPAVTLTEHNKRPMIKIKANMFFKENPTELNMKNWKKLIS